MLSQRPPARLAGAVAARPHISGGRAKVARRWPPMGDQGCFYARREVFSPEPEWEVHQLVN
jgi:hypothetical protein